MTTIALFRLQGDSAQRETTRLANIDKVSAAFLAHLQPGQVLTVLQGIDEPQHLKLHREGTDYTPPHDFVIKADFSDKRSFENGLNASGLLDVCSDWSAFEVEVVSKKPRTDPDATGLTPGIHFLHPLYFHDDLPQSAILRSWREIHGELALRVHVGGRMYLQNLVLETIKQGSASPYGGFSEFHFANMAALEQGYFDNDRGRLEIRHDIRHFIKGVPARLFAKEYRFRK